MYVHIRHTNLQLGVTRTGTFWLPRLTHSFPADAPLFGFSPGIEPGTTRNEVRRFRPLGHQAPVLFQPCPSICRVVCRINEILGRAWPSGRVAGFIPNGIGFKSRGRSVVHLPGMRSDEIPGSSPALPGRSKTTTRDTDNG